MELERHIESLLLHNDCVMVPGMGGFISHYVPARYEESENTFLPPYRSLGFNPQLRLNDSLLVQSYMAVHGISYEEATEMVKQAVDEVTSTLHHTGRYEFASLGVFTINNEGNIEFEPKEAGVLSPTLYGLDLFEFRTLANQAHLDSLSEDEEPYIRIKVRTLKTVAASAAAVFLGVLMVAGTFFGSGKNTFSQAGIVSISKMLPSPTTEENQEQDMTAPFTTLAQTPAIAEESASEESPVANGYSMVLACKIPRSNAEQFARPIRDKGYEVEVIGSEAESMVVYGNYPTNQQAYAALQQLRGESAFTNAWILHR